MTFPKGDVVSGELLAASHCAAWEGWETHAVLQSLDKCRQAEQSRARTGISPPTAWVQPGTALPENQSP